MVGAGACSSTLDVINNSKIHGKFNSSSAAYAYGMFLSFKVLALAASPRELWLLSCPLYAGHMAYLWRHRRVERPGLKSVAKRRPTLSSNRCDSGQGRAGEQAGAWAVTPNKAAERGCSLAFGTSTSTDAGPSASLLCVLTAMAGASGPCAARPWDNIACIAFPRPPWKTRTQMDLHKRWTWRTCKGCAGNLSPPLGPLISCPLPTCNIVTRGKASMTWFLRRKSLCRKVQGDTSLRFLIFSITEDYLLRLEWNTLYRIRYIVKPQVKFWISHETRRPCRILTVKQIPLSIAVSYEILLKLVEYIMWFYFFL